VAAVPIKAPRKVTYTSQVRTRAARDAAAAQVQPIYDLDRDLIAQQTRGLTDLIQAITTTRGDPNRRLGPDQLAPVLASLTVPPLSADTARHIAEFDDYRWGTVIASESQKLLPDILKDRIADDRVSEVRQDVALRVNPLLAPADRAVITELVQRFVRANLLLNRDATLRAQQAAREAVAAIEQTYERGQTVVRDGQVIGPLEIEALEALGLRNPELDWRSVGAAALLAFTLIGVLSAFIWHFDRPLLYRDRRMILLAGLLLVAVVAAKMIVPGRPLWAYVIPLPAVSMLLAILLDARLAISVSIVLGVTLAWIAGGALDVGVIALVGTMVGALAVWRKERMISYFVAGGEVAVAMIAAYLAFFLAGRSDDWTSMSVVSFELVVNGVLSSLLPVASFPLL